MNNMFYGCKVLTNIPQLDTSKVTNMSYMFGSCSALTSVPQLDTSSVTNMKRIFYMCSGLTIIPQLDTRNVTDISNMVYYCMSLNTLDITYYNISNTESASQITYMSDVKSFIIREFGPNYVLNSNAFETNEIGNGIGYIYVPRSMVDTLKSATNWSIYASQIRALEDYTVDGTTTGALDETKI